MKKLFTLLICLFYYQVQAQNTVIRGSYGKAELSLGAGTLLPSSDMKTTNNMGNLTSFNLGAYVPILNYGGATGGVISLGFNADATYFRGNSAYGLSNYPTYNITGQTGNPNITAKGSGSPKQAGFKTGGGVQANFGFGSYTVSPILNLAYVSLKQEAFTVSQTSAVNGQNYEHTLYTQAESKTSGVAVTPAIKHRYRFGKDWRFSIFAETYYMFGPSATTASTYFTPEGAANAQGNYNLNQMNFGTQTSQTKSTKFNGFGVNAGIGIALGSKSASANNRKARGKAALSDFTITKKDASAVVAQSTDGKLTKADAGKTKAAIDETSNPNAKETKPKVKCNCGTYIYGKDAAACRRICAFLKKGGYTINYATEFTPKELEQIKKDYLDGFMVTVNGEEILNPELFKLVTKKSDMVGQRVSIKKAGKQYAYLGDQDELVKIISIPSARAQECKDCNETDNCENSHHFDCCCNGGYCWCLICVEKVTMKDLPDGKLVNTDGGTTSPTSNEANRPGNGTGPVRWWRHNNNRVSGTNSCTGKGIYCFNRKSFMDAAEIRNFSADIDEILSESSVSLSRNVIIIKSIGIKGSLSPNTLSAFKEKKVEPLGNYMSMETLNLFLNKVNLKAPKEGVTIKPEEQSYSVYDTTYEGKKVSIVEAVEKTKLLIDGKTYTLVIISTSGKGTGSPKQQGF